MDGIPRSLPVRKCVKNSKSTEHSSSYIPFSKIYKMRSIDYNFSFLLFFLSVMKQKRRKYFNIRSRNGFYPFVIDTSPNRLREERS